MYCPKCQAPVEGKVKKTLSEEDAGIVCEHCGTKLM